VYEVTSDGAIRHQEEEFAWGEYWSQPDLIVKVDQWRLVSGGLLVFRRYLREQHD
jgi:hypothetical protein